jgi:hypothetical protein
VVKPRGEHKPGPEDQIEHVHVHHRREPVRFDHAKLAHAKEHGVQHEGSAKAKHHDVGVALFTRQNVVVAEVLVLGGLEHGEAVPSQEPPNDAEANQRVDVEPHAVLPRRRGVVAPHNDEEENDDRNRHPFPKPVVHFPPEAFFSRQFRRSGSGCCRCDWLLAHISSFRNTSPVGRDGRDCTTRYLKSQ